MTSAEAANRRGSHRSGGTNSHGKGSHYEGGHFTEQIITSISNNKSIDSVPVTTVPTLPNSL
ncbi:hypothetical protein [Microcoleus sp. FACHB-831]|uniref:hypothetical protein n=1 Tax=Microcoleus sp. FACHB-831 TaxID=2692827 RepID=UPI0016894648|nr:hypothetical protein [Microcoleus sp. FACHB-831]